MYVYINCEYALADVCQCASEVSMHYAVCAVFAECGSTQCGRVCVIIALQKSTHSQYLPPAVFEYFSIYSTFVSKWGHVMIPSGSQKVKKK